MQTVGVAFAKQLATVAEGHNRILPIDLRQTPADLLGTPFQNYLYLCARLDGPTGPEAARELRVLRSYLPHSSEGNYQASYGYPTSPPTPPARPTPSTPSARLFLGA